MEATTKKNLTVLRNQGTWGTVRVSSFIRHMLSIDMLTKIPFWYEPPSILLLVKVINLVVGNFGTMTQHIDGRRVFLSHGGVVEFISP